MSIPTIIPRAAFIQVLRSKFKEFSPQKANFLFSLFDPFHRNIMKFGELIVMLTIIDKLLTTNQRVSRSVSSSQTQEEAIPSLSSVKDMIVAIWDTFGLYSADLTPLEHALETITVLSLSEEDLSFVKLFFQKEFKRQLYRTVILSSSSSSKEEELEDTQITIDRAVPPPYHLCNSMQKEDFLATLFGSSEEEEGENNGILHLLAFQLRDLSEACRNT